MENIPEDESKLIVIETNLMQRNIEDFKLSDRARIITEWHKLMKTGTKNGSIKENTEDHHSEKMRKPFHLENLKYVIMSE